MTIAVDWGDRHQTKPKPCTYELIYAQNCNEPVKISFLILIKFTYFITGMLAIIEYHGLGTRQPQQELLVDSWS